MFQVNKKIKQNNLSLNYMVWKINKSWINNNRNLIKVMKKIKKEVATKNVKNVFIKLDLAF
jgi:hypothetical protein